MKMRKRLSLIAASGMLFAPSSPCDQAGEQAPDEMKVSVDGSPLRLNSLPFSVGQVLDYFTEAFGRGPFKMEGKSFVYKDRENPDEVALIIVSDPGGGTSVVLLATGGYGVNYIREFFVAPFFLREETEQLYKLLDRGPGIRSVTLERFNIQMGITAAESWVVVAIEFSPPQLYRPDLALVTSRAG
jgi:hypothetical protein